MANINLGKIRSLGRQRGFATAISDRLAAEAKMAEEDRAYQRLLKRDEENRAFQSTEAEKTRAAAEARAKISAEAEEKHREKMYGFKSRELDSLAEQRKIERQTKRDNVNRSMLNVILENNAKIGKETSAKDILLKHPDMGELPNFTAIVDSFNSRAGHTLKEKDEQVSKYWTNAYRDNKLTANDADVSWEILKKVNAPILQTKDKGVLSRLAWRRHIISRQQQKEASRQNTNYRTTKLGDNISFLIYTENAKKSLLDDKNPGEKIRKMADFLKEEDANLGTALGVSNVENLKKLTDEEKFKIKDFYVDKLRKFARSYSVKDSDASFRIKKAFLMQSNMRTFNKLVDEKVLNEEEVLHEAGFLADKDTVKVKKTYMPSAKKKISTIEDTDVLDMLTVPSGEAVERRFDTVTSTRRDLFQRWAKTDFNPNDVIPITIQTATGPKTVEKRYKDALLDTFRDSNGNINPAAYQKIIRAIDAAMPENITQASDDKALDKTMKNPRRVLSKTSQDAWAKMSKTYREQLDNASEVKILANDIRDIAEAVKGTAGTSGSIITAFESTIATIRNLKDYTVANIDNMYRDVVVNIGGKKVNIADVKRQAINSLPADSNERKERENKFRNLDKRVSESLQAINKMDISLEQKQLRQLMVFKQIALTYRMSGLLQGDSSGRSISNQDFDYALKAIWGEDYAVIPKMDAVILFFDHKERIAKTALQYGGTGIGDLAMELVRDQNAEISRQIMSDMISGIRNPVDFDQLPEMSPLLKSIDEIPDYAARRNEFVKNITQAASKGNTTFRDTIKAFKSQSDVIQGFNRMPELQKPIVRVAQMQIDKYFKGKTLAEYERRRLIQRLADRYMFDIYGRLK